jgi:nitrogen regulatory protein P-II 1
MKRIECIIRPLKLEEVKIALGEMGVTGMTVTDVRGVARQGGYRETYLGDEYVIDLPTKIRIDIIAQDEEVDPIVEAILSHARTGEPGDGKIFILPMEDAIRIRTEDRGEEAI